MSWDHVEQNIKISGDFDKYLKNVFGHTNEQWCEEKLRYLVLRDGTFFIVY
jgi:hypothetical protein